MSGPLKDLLERVPVAGGTVEQPSTSFDDLYARLDNVTGGRQQQKLQETAPTGFFDMITNFGSNVFNFAASEFAPDDYEGDSNYLKKLSDIRRDTRSQLGGSPESLKIAMNDFKNFFSKAREDPSIIRQSVKEVLGAVFNDPLAVAGAIPTAFASIVTSPLEATTGLTFTHDELAPFTPEMRAARVKETAALAVSIGLGIGARTGAKAALGVKSVTTAPRLGRLAIGASEALAGGIAYEAIAGAGTEDFSDRIINGIMFAPLGVAFELAHGRKARKVLRTLEDAELAAKEINKLQTLRYSEDDSVEDLGRKASAILTSDNVDEAVAKVVATKGKTGLVELPHQYGKRLYQEFRNAVREPATPFGNKVRANEAVIGLDDRPPIGIADREGILKKSNVKFIGEEAGSTNPDTKIKLRDLRFSVDGQEVAVMFHMSDDKTAVLDWFGSPDVEGGPPQKLSLGATAIREIQRQILEKHPNIKRIEGLRMSGASRSAGANSHKVELEVRPRVLDEPNPTVSFNQLIDDFAAVKGITDPRKIDALRKTFSREMINELLTEMDPDERAIIQGFEKEFMNYDKSLEVRALDKGMKLEREDALTFALRDVESGRIIQRLDGEENVKKFLDLVETPKGPDLDGGGNGAIPPITTNVPLSQAATPPPNNTPFLQESFLGKASDAIRKMVPVMTPSRAMTVSFDNRFGSNFFVNVWDALQQGKVATLRAAEPWMLKLKEIDQLTVGMTRQERELIGAWMESISPDEIMIAATKTRGATAAEVAFARKWVKNNIDVTRVLQYKAKLDLIKKKWEPTDPSFIKAKEELDKKFGLDEFHTEALNDMEAIVGSKENSLGVSTRLFRAITENGISRKDFAIKHKMTANQIAIGRKMDRLYEELATEFGIADYQQLNSYMTHARLGTGGEIRSALRGFGLNAQEIKFYAAMQRTGLWDVYERDPIRALQRYIKAGYDAKHFNPHLRNARKYIKDELTRLNETGKYKLGELKQVQSVMEKYIESIRGNHSNFAVSVNSAVNDFLKSLRIIKKDSEIDATAIANAISIVGESAAQGFRPIAGIRDFYTGVSLYVARYGLARTRRMLTLASKGLKNKDFDFTGTIFEGLDDVTRAKLIEIGFVPELNPVLLTNPMEATSSAVGRTANKIAPKLQKLGQASIKLSGQKDVYSLLHTGAYLEVWERASKAFRKFENVNDGTKLAKISKEMELESFDLPVVKEFSRLVNEDKFKEAAHFLARQNGYEQVNVYGLANHSMGWNNPIGRVAGQFGTWPNYFRTHLGRMVSRGSRGYRTKVALRFIATQGALVLAQDNLGINLNTWKLPGAWLFVGGPTLDYYRTVADALNGYGAEQDLALSNLKRMLPHDGEQFHLRQIYIPGSNAANDIFSGLQMLDEGQDATRSFARMMGFRSTED